MTLSKILIVYFSSTGNNRLLAQFLKKELECDLVPITEVKRRSGLTTLADILLNRVPKIQDLLAPIENYQHVIFIAPLWNGRIATPLKALIQKKRDSIRSYSFITLCGGYEIRNQMQKIRTELVHLTGQEPNLMAELDLADLFPKNERKQFIRISNYRIQANDLLAFKERLREIIGHFRAMPEFKGPRSQTEPLKEFRP